MHRQGDKKQYLLLWQQNFRGKRTILAVPADIALIPVNDGINAHQPVTVVRSLGGKEPAVHFLLLLQGGGVGK